jgi:divalent metal cation (Fe/Co/Zn/Cd) transporter
MKPIADFEFPPEQGAIVAKARRLEWITLAYLASAATLLYVTMGTSQAMKTGFFDDIISLAPAIAFLVCTRIASRSPSHDYPYGLHGAVSIGYLVASLALCAMGLFLLFEAGAKLLRGERTTIGGMSLFGFTVWAGWPMLVAIAYSAVPNFFLGVAKLRLATKIHDKILYADAKMMNADWLAGLATTVGVLGTGFGWWWLDPVAAVLVSMDILKDGVVNVGVAVADLIERRPRKTDRSAEEPLPDDLRRWLERQDWVERAAVRLRETGHVFIGEAFVVPRTTDALPQKIAVAAESAKRLDWRLHELVITPVPRLDGDHP